LPLLAACKCSLEALSGCGRRVGRSGTGASLGQRRRVGRFARWASSPGFSFGRRCDLPGLCREHVSVCVVVPLVLPLHVNQLVEVRMALARWVGRVIGLEFTVTSAWPRSARTARFVPLVGCRARRRDWACWPRAWCRRDRVALEVTGSCWEVARILEPHGDRVVVVSPDDTGDHAGAREDRSARRAHVGQAFVVGRA
jgi:hypothetical protein